MRSAPAGIFVDPKQGLMIRFEDNRERKATDTERATMLAALRAVPQTPDAVLEWERLNSAFHKALTEYPDCHNALHFLWNSTIASTPTASAVPQAEAVGYFCFVDSPRGENEPKHIRAWTSHADRAKSIGNVIGRELQPLYAHPQPQQAELYLGLYYKTRGDKRNLPQIVGPLQRHNDTMWSATVCGTDWYWNAEGRYLVDGEQHSRDLVENVTVTIAQPQQADGRGDVPAADFPPGRAPEP